MGLCRFKPLPSGRMGILWTLSTIRDAAIIEFGCMGHMLYSSTTLERTGVYDGARLYSTHIDETDIAFGDTNRLNRTIENVIKEDSPKIIFIIPSSVPEITGIDIHSVCCELQSKYPDVLLLPFEYGGFDIIQHRGIEETLLLLVKKIPVEIERSEITTFNIIGSCADLFRFQADTKEILRIMEGAFNMKPVCIMTSDTDIRDIENMGSAHINLVLRREGLKTAEYLKDKFNTPYILNRPYGVEGTMIWLNEISKILEIPLNNDFITNEKNILFKQFKPAIPSFRHLVRSHPDEAILSLGGHIDVVEGLISFGCNELSLTKGVCWCDSPHMGSEEIPYLEEDEWTEVVKSHKKGYLMTSGEALAWFGHNTELQISNPDIKWRLHPYEPPFLGFRGAINLVNLWINDIKED